MYVLIILEILILFTLIYFSFHKNGIIGTTSFLLACILLVHIMNVHQEYFDIKLIFNKQSAGIIIASLSTIAVIVFASSFVFRIF